MNLIGKFYVENDTLVAFQSEEEAQKANADEDVNNKMFIVVRNLKTTSSKSVSIIVVLNFIFRTTNLKKEILSNLEE
jgi:hypothetical protein